MENGFDTDPEFVIISMPPVKKNEDKEKVADGEKQKATEHRESDQGR